MAAAFTMLILVILWPAKVSIGRDGCRTGKVLQALLGLGGARGVVCASAKVHVGRDSY
jgi:hypothetical protein